MNSLLINKDNIVVSGDKIFYTLQGEGKTMGYSVVFLRLKFCDLRCSWCDTPYAVYPEREDFKREGEQWTIEETAKKINEAWKCKNPKVQKRLVITGGEPLLQKEALDNLIELLRDSWLIEIETNGTVMPTQKMLAMSEFEIDMPETELQFNCSPKLRNSGNSKIVRYKPKVLKELNKVNTQFKFVVATAGDLEEVEKEYITPLSLDVQKVVLMPLGTNTEDIFKHMRAVAELAKEKGYRMLSRLQIEIWGMKRQT